MLHETMTSLPVAEVLTRAKAFFAERVPSSAAFPEREGASFVTLRGQGGEEIAVAATEAPGGTRVRASTLFFDQVVARFLTTLPEAAA